MTSIPNGVSVSAGPLRHYKCYAKVIFVVDKKRKLFHPTESAVRVKSRRAGSEAGTLEFLLL